MSTLLKMSLVALVTSLVVIFVYDRWFTVRYLTVDLNGFLSAQKRAYTHGKINKAEFDSRIQTFTGAIKTYPGKVLILDESAVIRGALPLFTKENSPQDR